MRRVLPVLCLTLLATPLRAQGAKTVDEAWKHAFTAGDPAALAALYAPDATMYPPDEMVSKGRDAIRAGYEKFFSAHTVTDVRLEYDFSSTSGDLSVASGRYSFKAQPKAGGAAQTIEGRFTSVAARKGGKWMYVSDHASAPIPPPAPK
ncbi:MAG TPA: SgcJ/EcaC family oxidoreductase [Thermoanaerobaculia bacterium]|jgi:uncharacterized protein (TIGR02246 family)